jgi:hydroxypyruvate isomerase
MVTLAANLSMLFTDLPFLDRFTAAAEAGFEAVEFLFPYAETREDVAAALERNKLKVALFNFPAGDWDGGERGIGALPDRVAEFRGNVALALSYAQHLNCKRLHLLAGVTTKYDQAECRKTFVSNIQYAADAVAGSGINILLEPINTKVDMPGYFYDTSAKAMAIIADVGRPNVKLQYDIYHMQIMEGDLARTMKALLPSIGHMQLADNPGRGEPGSGEINYPWLLRYVDEIGYAGFVGCEYKPVTNTKAGLGWAAPYLLNRLLKK